jgi:hypothetical protein
MGTDYTQSSRRILCTFCVLMLAFVCRAGASATLLLEEPYGKLGFFTATGHVAVYLSGVCADSPIVLRVCAPGEAGIVLSRYDGVGGYDWVAIPLIPYLYAVERADDVPLFADARMVAFLRDRYRRKYLEQVAPDQKNGDAPGGNWYELVGSSYDRAIYGFEIQTKAERDAALVRKYNALRNREHFRTVSHNCADFAKDVINFYYPRALHRSLVADIGITTPKQMAKRMVKFGEHHPELQFSRLVIPQVPGSMARSTAVHGVVESFLKSSGESDLCRMRGRGLCGNGHRPLRSRPQRAGVQRRQRSGPAARTRGSSRISHRTETHPGRQFAGNLSRAGREGVAAFTVQGHCRGG